MQVNDTIKKTKEFNRIFKSIFILRFLIMV